MALISDTHKFIYIQGGKVATGSIGGALDGSKGVKVYEFEKTKKGWWRKYSKHMPAKTVRDNIETDKWENYFKFTFVRNPYDWVKSVYCSLTRVKSFEERKLGEKHVMKVVEYCKSPVGRRFDDTITMRTQTDFISDTKGNIIVDFIGKFENIQEDYNKITKTLGIQKRQLSKVNRSASSKHHYREAFTPEGKAIVDLYFKRDIETFGYCF